MRFRRSERGNLFIRGYLLNNALLFMKTSILRAFSRLECRNLLELRSIARRARNDRFARYSPRLCRPGKYMVQQTFLYEGQQAWGGAYVVFSTKKGAKLGAELANAELAKR
jgi:hypothetical protein